MSLADRHGGRAKRIMAETSITVGKEGVQVVFRDTGEMGDLTDGDAPVRLKAEVEVKVEG